MQATADEYHTLLKCQWNFNHILLSYRGGGDLMENEVGPWLVIERSWVRIPQLVGFFWKSAILKLFSVSTTDIFQNGDKK